MAGLRCAFGLSVEMNKRRCYSMPPRRMRLMRVAVHVWPITLHRGLGHRLNKGLGAGLATIAAWLAFTLGLGGVPPSLLGATSLDVIRVYRRCVSRHGSILDLHAHRCSMLVTALTSCPVCRVA